VNDKSQPCIHDYLVGVLMHEYYVILSYVGPFPYMYQTCSVMESRPGYVCS
jgi:hypothetical protein